MNTSRLEAFSDGVLSIVLLPYAGMRRRGGGVKRLMLAALLVCGAAPARAQAPDARMLEFRTAVARLETDSVAAFFPRRGEWSWVRTIRHPGRPDRVEVRRFPPSETRGVIGRGGAACVSFAADPNRVEPGALVTEATYALRWRRLPGNRFVPVDAPARSPVFVEWRREDGRWVVSSFGDETFERPRLLGVEAGMIRRDPVRSPLALPLPSAGHYAGTQPWFAAREPLTFEGWPYLMSGPPRALRSGEATRIASLGRVGVYAEAGQEAAPSVLYLPVDARGEFQPYVSDARRSPRCP